MCITIIEQQLNNTRSDISPSYRPENAGASADVDEGLESRVECLTGLARVDHKIRNVDTPGSNMKDMVEPRWSSTSRLWGYRGRSNQRSLGSYQEYGF